MDHPNGRRDTNEVEYGRSWNASSQPGMQYFGANKTATPYDHARPNSSG